MIYQTSRPTWLAYSLIGLISFTFKFSATELLTTKGGTQKNLDTEYGVNIGGWLLAEGWIYPKAWKKLGGEICSTDCTTCVSTEWALTKKLGQEAANKAFLGHWKTWFTGVDVQKIKKYGLDHVRIPLPFWIFKELVDPKTEQYPQGGYPELKRGLRLLKAAGIRVILDLHAAPGVASSKEVFAGHCTDKVMFYTEENYLKALTWAGVMTIASHRDPDFETVVAIEALNEPLRDMEKTPGLQSYYEDFATVIRAVEQSFAVPCPSLDRDKLAERYGKSTRVKEAIRQAHKLSRRYVVGQPGSSRAQTTEDLHVTHAADSTDTTNMASDPQTVVPEHKLATRDATLGATKTGHLVKSCMEIQAMTSRWQNGPESSKATISKVALGPTFVDDHLYYSFGGMAEPNIESYLRMMCTNTYLEDAKRRGEVPYGHQEFSIATNFNATKEELRKWGDAQKFKYGQEHRMTFWTFKTEKSEDDPAQVTWSYFDSVEQGLLTTNPRHFFDSNVCKPYIGQSETR